MANRENKLARDRAILLVIDIQQKLLPLVQRCRAVLAASCQMLRGAGIFDLPILVTEQYPEGIGPTHADVLALLGKGHNQDQGRFVKTLAKSAFSACGDDAFCQALSELGRRQVIIVGIETHVCVQSVTLDLLAMGYDVYVCADAVSSRGPIDHEVAMQRMREAGARITTVESVLFELCDRSDDPQFKRMLKVIKSPPSPQG